MNMQKIYYDMADKLRPYAEPYMDKLCKEAASNATCAGEPYEALADYLSFAWEHQNTPRKLIKEWRYIFIPSKEIQITSSFNTLAKRFVATNN